MTSISNSITLFKASWRVLQQDRELLIFPLLSGVSMVLVVASFALPVWATGAWTMLEEGGDPSYVGYVLTFLFYLVQYTVIFFFNTALVGAALERMRGGDPTVSSGLSLAVSRLPAILGYAAISATVGMILRAIAERSGAVGRFVIGFLGIGWSLATYLAVPVLAARDTGPIDTVKESAQLFRKTWGEQVSANFGFGAIGALAAFVLGLLFVGGLMLTLSMGGGVLVVPVVAIFVAGWLLLFLVLSTLKGIYSAALYQYATEGRAAGFDETIIGRAFEQK